MDILRQYGDASGQEINMSKSEVFFSCNISGPSKEDLAGIMGVRHVLVPNVKQWDIQKIKQLFMHDVVLEIMKVPFLEDMKEDCLVWKEESHGNYSVKMGYKLLKKDLSASINLQVEGD
ncbi:hypothetical protein KIW84_056538 [Lathyrus oleraceus]|uniref:Uncharacterized protein n=1 Tax=Pisum sativum TaxID=3888 RepID=A0A9D4X1R4_PEA|nr:hypothetical protein KIW84_056538 [Pisum sativum]